MAIRQVTALCLLLSLTSAVDVKLRPYEARHQHHKALVKAAAPAFASHFAEKAEKVKKEKVEKVEKVKVVAKPQPPVKVAPKVAVPPPAPVVAAAPPTPVEDVPEPEATPVAQPLAKPATQAAAVKQLQDDLVEVKQMRANVVAVEQTLAADVSLLRESALLQKMSSSPQGRAAAHQQVQQTERLVKETEAMVVTSRKTAVARAKEALLEASEVQKAADALSAEAKAQLKSVPARFLPKKAEAAPVEPAPVAKPVDSDDVADGPDEATAAADDLA